MLCYIPRSVPQPVISKETSSNWSSDLCRNHSHVVCGGSKLEVSPRYLPFEFKESCGSGSRKLLRGRGDRGQQEQRFWPLRRAHKSSQGLKQETQGLPGSVTGPLHICQNIMSEFLWDSWLWEQVGHYSCSNSWDSFLPVGLTRPTSI